MRSLRGRLRRSFRGSRSQTPSGCCSWPSTKPWRFETAAPRWHARLCAEARLTLPEAQLALSAVHALGGPGAVGAGQALVGICDVHRLDDVVRVLDTWLNARE
jgi:hypothetical protein